MQLKASYVVIEKRWLLEKQLFKFAENSPSKWEPENLFSPAKQPNSPSKWEQKTCSAYSFSIFFIAWKAPLSMRFKPLSDNSLVQK